MALVGAGALWAPAVAPAATAALDLPCYVAGQPGRLALTGFAPGVEVTVANADLGTTRATTDAGGGLSLPFTPPSGADLPRPGSRPFVLTATADGDPGVTATATGRVAPLAFATDRGTRSPRALRTWSFSGFTPGRVIYAHFRLQGRTRGTHRFGPAAGPCGELRRRAPAIAIAGRVRPGVWTIQVDQSPAYSRATRPALRDRTVVFPTFRQRRESVEE